MKQSVEIGPDRTVRRLKLILLVGIAGFFAWHPVRATAGDAAVRHVWVHYDYMVGPDGVSEAPGERAIEMVVAAYRAQGIILHIDPQHTQLPFHRTIYFKTGGFQVCTDDLVYFEDLKAKYFHPQSNLNWNYAIFARYYGIDPSFAFDPSLPQFTCFDSFNIGPNGVSEGIPGVNFVVTLGALRDLRFFADQWDFAVGAIFMHELGHNVGLHHGGGEDLNFKPNYISVMNYNFSSIYSPGIPFATMPGATNIAGYRLDYSNGLLPTLDEQHLNEGAGLGGPSTYTDISRFYADCGTRLVLIPTNGSPIDWNQNGVATDPDVPLGIAGSYCNGPPILLLADFDDWAAVRGYLDNPGPHDLVRRPHTIE